MEVPTPAPPRAPTRASPRLGGSPPSSTAAAARPREADEKRTKGPWTPEEDVRSQRRYFWPPRRSIARARPTPRAPLPGQSHRTGARARRPKVVHDSSATARAHLQAVPGAVAQPPEPRDLEGPVDGERGQGNSAFAREARESMGGDRQVAEGADRQCDKEPLELVDQAQVRAVPRGGDGGAGRASRRGPGRGAGGEARVRRGARNDGPRRARRRRVDAVPSSPQARGGGRADRRAAGRSDRRRPERGPVRAVDRKPRRCRSRATSTSSSARR